MHRLPRKPTRSSVFTSCPRNRWRRDFLCCLAKERNYPALYPRCVLPHQYQKRYFLRQVLCLRNFHRFFISWFSREIIEHSLPDLFRHNLQGRSVGFQWQCRFRQYNFNPLRLTIQSYRNRCSTWSSIDGIFCTFSCLHFAYVFR